MGTVGTNVRSSNNPVVVSNFTVNATGALGSPATIAVGGFTEVLVYLTVANAPTGTSPTLDVKVQYSPDGNTWFDGASSSFTQITGASTPNVLKLTSIGEYIRVFATIGGSASPTFTGVSCWVVAKS